MKDQTEFLQSKKLENSYFISLIEKKRDGYELEQEEIKNIIDAIINKAIPSYQISALIMAIYFKGLSVQEISYLIHEIILSGELVDLSSISNPKIEQYSFGGVGGDTSSLIIGSIASACGVVMPSMISEEEEKENYIISDISKLNAIPGFSSKINLNDAIKQLYNIGCIFIEKPKEIAPIDSILYEFRKKTATLQSIPLITASILSQKLAQGIEGLVVDIKYGNGSYLKNVEEAKNLARSITRVGRAMKRRCVAIVTNINQPIGCSIGTGLEIEEAIEVLKGGGSNEIKELILKISMEVVRLGGVAGSTLSAKQMIQKVIKEGLALDKFYNLIKFQGGNIDIFKENNFFQKAKYIKKLPSPKRGYIHNINTEMITKAVKILAYSPKYKNNLDPYVGICKLKKIGDQVKQGEPLMMIHYNEENEYLEESLKYLKTSYKLAPKRPSLQKLIIERIA